jgi:penicillin amidase
MRANSLRRLLAVTTFASFGLMGCSSDSTKPVPIPIPPTGDPTGPIGTRADLPVDEQVTIENLSAPVDIVRDKYGRPHIYAASVTDAMRAEGWLVAKDRAFELEFFRRVSEGRLAEILSDSDQSTIDLDISYRHIGLGRTAKLQYDALPKGEMRDLVDAYADGISQVFRKLRTGKLHLPDGLFGIPQAAFTDWTGVDSLAIGRLQTHLLSYDADVDLGNQLFFDSARATFKAGDADPVLAKRANLERDMFLFTPGDPATTTTGYPTGKPRILPPGKEAKAWKHPDLSVIAKGYLAASQRSRALLRPEGFGSNNWAIAASRSKTGHALVASDPHLSLIAPSIFWPVSIDVTAPAGGDPTGNLKVGGVAFPGIPGIILGHNEHIAWGATVAGYDVSDAYAETLTPDGQSVMWKGKAVPLETVDEVIKLQSGDPITYHVRIVPHHGPIEPNITGKHVIVDPDPKVGAVSIRWTGIEPTTELSAVFSLLHAKDVDEAQKALDAFGVGAQNWMLGDTSGNILWTSHANVPVRDPNAFAWNAKTYSGNLPCFILPGDGTADWTGYLDGRTVPWEKNPAAGFLSTANNDPIGNTLDNDPSNDTLPDGKPMYLASQFDIGFREGRIQKRIKDHTAPFTTDDLQAIQADARSAMGAALTPSLLDAIDRAEEEKKTPGTHPDLTAVVADPLYKSATILAVRDLLDSWGKDADFEAASGVDADTNLPKNAAGKDAVEVKASQATLVFNTWLVRVLGRTFGDELSKMGVTYGREDKAKAFLRLIKGDPATFATFDAATGDSSLWDDLTTPAVESRHERMVRALLDALTTLEALAGPDLATYRWGTYHTITFEAVISIFGKLTIPPSTDDVFPHGFPRHGDSFGVDSSDFSFVGLSQAPLFNYAHGPSQRFVIDMDPSGPKAFNALPGGNVWDAKSPHFRDEAEYWRRNQAHAVPFLLTDVIAAKETRTVATAPVAGSL